MSQSPGTKSSKSSSELKPALKAVLGCLDVQLEQELTRYRRIRRRTKPSKSGDSKPNQAFHKPPEAVTLSGLDLKVNGNATSGAGSSAKRTGWESVVIPESAPLVVASKTTESGQNGNVSNGTIPSSNNHSEAYLESSERLLKTLDEAKPATPPKRSLAASLFTPLGITSMFLLFLSCMGLGYVVFSPSGRMSLGLDRFWKTTPSTANAPTTTTESEEATIAVEPQSPNLARQEFVELNLNNLSNINPNPNPLPTVDTPASVPPSPNLNTPPAPASDPTLGGPGLNNLNRELLPQATPSAVAPAPTTTTAPVAAPVPIPGGGSSPQTSTQPRTQTPTQPTAKDPIKAEDGLYYVVVDYVDERALEKAREVVPDAYIRDFKTGVKIQLGALSDAASAKRLVEELKAQGITGQYDLPKPETSQG